ncbi:MAG TPA: hypothetical protein VMF70_07280 [Gemmatimonadales bacterium]|nr:hypothetical protein [Gemmatimonadales bacterium]
MKENIDNSVMTVTALSPIIGYDRASVISRYAIDHDLTLKQAALDNGVTEELYNRVVKPLALIQGGSARQGRRHRLLTSCCRAARMKEARLQAVVSHRLALAAASLVSSRLATHALSSVRSLSKADDLLGGLWAVLATLFVYREGQRQRAAALSRAPQPRSSASRDA